MHDLDRTFLELAPQSDPAGAIASEFWSAPPTPAAREVAYGNGQPSKEVFDEMTEMELASELLGAQSDHEVEHFLGGLFKKAESFLGKALHSTVGKEILGQLKNVAKSVLPSVGAALGNYLVPGVGGTIGRTLATQAGQAMGLELEGMSPADQEFEVARRVVRLGAQAARNAAGFSPATPVEAVRAAQAAMEAAVRDVAPGLLRYGNRPEHEFPGEAGGGFGAPHPLQGHLGEAGRERIFFGGEGRPGERARTGRWVRSRHGILLIGV
jgi:hypothetical protein